MKMHTSISASPKIIEYFRNKIISWGQKNYSQFPWRNTKNKWHALVAEMMLQRTRAEQVVPAYQNFSKNYPTAQDFMRDKKAEAFKSLGLYWREKQIKKLAICLSGKDIPQDRRSLLRLPGVGEYIASAMRSLHFGKRDVIIDSNIVRLYGRFFGFATHSETRRKKWLKDFAEKLTPKKNFLKFNYALIDFTRCVCKPNPLFQKCPLSCKCNFYKSGRI